MFLSSSNAAIRLPCSKCKYTINNIGSFTPRQYTAIARTIRSSLTIHLYEGAAGNVLGYVYCYQNIFVATSFSAKMQCNDPCHLIYKTWSALQGQRKRVLLDTISYEYATCIHDNALYSHLTLCSTVFAMPWNDLTCPGSRHNGRIKKNISTWF